MRLFLSLIVIFISSHLCFSQAPTIGLLLKEKGVENGYTLFTPEQNNDAYLINNCGLAINHWTFNEKPGATCYLLENGNLLRAGRDSIAIKDWNNNLVWSYAMNANGYLQHHDIEPLPNGNVLCLLSDIFNDSLTLLLGKDSALNSTGIKLDRIVELSPIGSDSAELVWEWRFSEHLIQDKNPAQNNFGTVSNHPELLDINYGNTDEFDFTHANAIDYNSALDQIIISARALSEIYVIDHSTSAIEAKGHSGGNSNKGGDFLWRWGNPQVYNQGTSSNRKLFFQHDAKWVQNGYLDYGKISVFNNNGDTINGNSTLDLIEPIIVNGTYQVNNGAFLPNSAIYSWGDSILGNPIKESKKSGVQSLPNGNLLICETSTGQISEITKSGRLVWVYKNPVTTTILNQYTDPSGVQNSIFRAEKYPTNYTGFNGVTLTINSTIENINTTSDSCTIIGLSNQNLNEVLSITNPVLNGQINFNTPLRIHSVVIIDINGRLIYTNYNVNGNQINTNLRPGIYFIKTETKKGLITNKILVQ